MKLTGKIASAVFGRDTLHTLFAFAACSVVGCMRDSSHGYNPKQFSCRSQSSVVNALGSQAAVGLDLANTVWNHHFDEFTSDLNQMGRNHLTRYIRRSASCPQQLFLQTAYDVGTFDQKSRKYLLVRQDEPDEFLKQRAKLDYKRIEVLHEYLFKYFRMPPTEIVVIDPAPTSIHSEELMRSQRLMIRNVEGFLPREMTRSEFRFGGGEGMDYGGDSSFDLGGGGDLSDFGNDPGANPSQAPFGTDGGTPGFGSEIPTTPSSSSSPSTSDESGMSEL